MELRKVASGIAWLPLLGGCMGMGVGGHPGGTAPGVHRSLESAPVHAEASNGEITIALFLPAPSAGAVVDVDVRLLSEGGERDSADREVRLRIAAPSGGVDEIVMHRAPATSAGRYHARYVFRHPGPYLVTAEAWSALVDVPTVSVTAEADVVGYRDRQDWLMPAAIVGGVAMFTMMVAMMAF